MKSDIYPLLSDQPYPVQSFFYQIRPGMFPAILRQWASGNGYAFNYEICNFPENLAEDNCGNARDYPYIEFWASGGSGPGEEFNVSFDQFLEILDRVVAEEIRKNPSSTNEINELVEKTRSYLRSL